MRESEYMVEKVGRINDIRKDKSKELMAAGEVPLDSYEFEYYLLCNKICGQGHYNMQMKIVVESEEDYKAWIKEQQTFGATMAAVADVSTVDVSTNEDDTLEEELDEEGNTETELE
jgi:cytochrome c oxidase subunit 2